MCQRPEEEVRRKFLSEFRTTVKDYRNATKTVESITMKVESYIVGKNYKQYCHQQQRNLRKKYCTYFSLQKSDIVTETLSQQ